MSFGEFDRVNRDGLPSGPGQDLPGDGGGDAVVGCERVGAVAGVVGNWGGVVSGLFNEP